MATLDSKITRLLRWSGLQSLSNGQNITDNILLTGNVQIDVPNGAEATISGFIQGPPDFTVTKTGGGKLFLTGNNTYPGKTFILDGRITIVGSLAGDVDIAYIDAILEFFHSNVLTHSGVISGVGSVMMGGNGKTILTGNNTFTGQTVIANGTLQIGNGTSGRIGNVSIIAVAIGATLRFEPGADMIFSQRIDGIGNVEYKGSNTKRLFLTFDNLYTGKTIIEAGCLYIGNNGKTGSVAGDIIVQKGAGLYFYRSNDINYSGVISGDGYMLKEGAGKLTLSGLNTYTGDTEIQGGTLALAAKGEIYCSSGLYIDCGNFDITSGRKTIRRLNGSTEGGIIFLGGNTLTVGIYGQADGDGYCGAIIDGSGIIIKQGTGTLTMGYQKAEVYLCLQQGGIVIQDQWPGIFEQMVETTLTVNGNVEFGKYMALHGGTVNMDLSGATPSKLLVKEGVWISENQTYAINISAIGTARSYPLITASQGGMSLSRFRLSGVNVGNKVLVINEATTELALRTSPTIIPTEITKHPEDATVVAGGSTSFSVVATGFGTLNYQWQYQTPISKMWVKITEKMLSYSGAETSTLKLTDVPAECNGYRYRCVVSNAQGDVTSNAATLTVTAALLLPVIAKHPDDATVVAGGSTSFSVMVISREKLKYQWQYQTIKSRVWIDIPVLPGLLPGLPPGYSGAATSTLKLTDVPSECNGYKYRCVVSNAQGDAISNAATLTVTAGKIR